MLTNDGPRFERYQVDFQRQDGEWVDAGGSGGFQTGTPEHVRQKANQLESDRGPAAPSLPIAQADRSGLAEPFIDRAHRVEGAGAGTNPPVPKPVRRRL